MIAILKDMKNSYYEESANSEEQELTELMAVMYAQASDIQENRSVTPEDMAEIVVNSIGQVGLDDTARDLVRKLCLSIFKKEK